MESPAGIKPVKEIVKDYFARRGFSEDVNQIWDYIENYKQPENRESLVHRVGKGIAKQIFDALDSAESLILGLETMLDDARELQDYDILVSGEVRRVFPKPEKLVDCLTVASVGISFSIGGPANFEKAQADISEQIKGVYE